MTSHLDTATLNLYLDDALDAKTRALSDAHLVTCADCRHELEGLRTVFSAFEVWRAEPIPRDVTPQVLARIAQRPVPQARVRWGAALLGAQLLIAGLLIVWVLPNLTHLVTGIPIVPSTLPTFQLPQLLQWLTTAPDLNFALPPFTVGMWLGLIVGSVALWLVAHRLILNSLARNQETFR